MSFSICFSHIASIYISRLYRPQFSFVSAWSIGTKLTVWTIEQTRKWANNQWKGACWVIYYASFLPSWEASIAFLITDARVALIGKLNGAQVPPNYSCYYQIIYVWDSHFARILMVLYCMRLEKLYRAFSRFECLLNRLPLILVTIETIYRLLYSPPSGGIRYWCIRLPISTGRLYPRCPNETIKTCI